MFASCRRTSHLVETLDGEACLGSAGVPIAVLGKAQAGIEKAHPSEGLAAVEPGANIVGKAHISNDGINLDPQTARGDVHMRNVTLSRCAAKIIRKPRADFDIWEAGCPHRCTLVSARTTVPKK
jgi:hypothetical protein